MIIFDHQIRQILFYLVIFLQPPFLGKATKTEEVRCPKCGKNPVKLPGPTMK